MVATTYLVSFLLLLSSVWAAPTFQDSQHSIRPIFKFPPVNKHALLCKIPVVKKYLCPRQGSSSVSVETSVGTARGTLDASGAKRFSVRYASASRWAESTPASVWELPNGSSDVTKLPLACPQKDMDSALYSEDCLSMIIYVPPTLDRSSSVPTLLWIHGGSFIVGSATGVGLDGSKLAVATNSIIAVVQYRLGALGFMAPDGSTNLALGDVVNSMRFLKTVLPAFGGNPSKITLAGQSSGGNMIRALLAVPTASDLFQSAIIQSDPINYGFLSTSTQSTLQTYFNDAIGCAGSDGSCKSALTLGSILEAQADLFSEAIYLDAAAGNAQPIRPVLDGSLLTSSFLSGNAFPNAQKPILITSVANEAGPAIYGNFQGTVSMSLLELITQATFGAERTSVIVDSPYYKGGNDARIQLQKMGTDYIWKCSAWTFSRNWANNGGTAYVGVYTVGATYPGNEDVPYCTEDGHVCHEDDITLVFGTTANPTSRQSALTTELQRRYKAFLETGSPNAGGLATWTKATSSDVHPLNLGGSGEIPTGACEPSFWGEAVKYDYQYYSS